MILKYRYRSGGMDNFPMIRELDPGIRGNFSDEASMFAVDYHFILRSAYPTSRWRMKGFRVAQ